MSFIREKKNLLPDNRTYNNSKDIRELAGALTVVSEDELRRRLADNTVNPRHIMLVADIILSKPLTLPTGEYSVSGDGYFIRGELVATKAIQSATLEGLDLTQCPIRVVGDVEGLSITDCQLGPTPLTGAGTLLNSVITGTITSNVTITPSLTGVSINLQAADVDFTLTGTGNWTDTRVDGNFSIQHGGSPLLNSFITISGDWDTTTGTITGSNIIARNFNTFSTGGVYPPDGNYGDITVTASGTTWEINPGSVELGDLANIPTDRLLGRDTAGTGPVELISLGTSLSFTGAGAIQRAALTGDVGAGVNSNITTIAANAVSNTKLRDSVANSVIGRATNTTGDPADIQATVSGHLLRLDGTTLGFGLIPESSVIGLVTDLGDRVRGPTPATSTDLAITRWDGTTGRLIQDSVATLTDAGLFRSVDGGVDGPTYSFTDENGLGWYRVATNRIGLAAAGSSIGQWGIITDPVSGLPLTTLLGPSITYLTGNASDYGNRYGWLSDQDTFITDFGGDRIRVLVGGGVSIDTLVTGTDLTTRFGGNSSSIPVISFTGDTDTGIGWDGTVNTIQFINGAANTLSLSSTYLLDKVGTVKAALAAGSAATPSFAFSAELNTGMYRSAAGELGFSILGTRELTLQTGILFAGTAVTGGYSLRDSQTAASPPYSFVSDPDTGIYRAGTNILGFSTGGTQAAQLTATNEFIVNGVVAVATNNNSSGTANLTINAALIQQSTWVANFTASRTLFISNLSVGRSVRIFIQNTSGTVTPTITIQASATTSGFTNVPLTRGSGGAPASTIILSLTNGCCFVDVIATTAGFAGTLT